MIKNPLMVDLKLLNSAIFFIEYTFKASQNDTSVVYFMTDKLSL